MPLRLFLRGEVWHYRGSVAGRRLRGSTGVSKPNKETAQHVVADIEARAWKGRLDGPASVLTFAAAALLYRTARKPTRYLDVIENHWRKTPVKNITAGAIRGSCLGLYPNAKAATWNRAVIVPTQAIINFAAEQELCPTIKVKRWPVDTKVRTPVTWQWVVEFSSASSPHLSAIALFMFLTGARIGEACSLRWSQVELPRQRALIHQTKTGTRRETHLPTELIVALANLPGDRHPDAKVFGLTTRTAQRQWAETAKRAGLEPLTPHCCRHGFATGLLHAGVDVITVSKLGGWKSPSQVLATYGHASEDRTLTDVLTQQEHSGNSVMRKLLKRNKL